MNIGLELAARPTILMLDEPTSGLDASTALEIIRSVKRLTAIGARATTDGKREVLAENIRLKNWL